MSVFCPRCGHAVAALTQHGICISCWVTERTDLVDRQHGAKPRRVVTHPEDDLQKLVCAFLDRAIRPPCRWWHCPNGGRRLGKEAARLKGLGVKAGVSDLHFAWRFDSDGTYGTSGFGVIELKSAEGRLTPEQEAFLSDMLALGHRTCVARSLPEVVNVLRAWGVPLHAAL